MAREPFNRIWTETPTVDDFGEPTNTMWDAGWRGGAAEDPPEAYAQNWWQNRADFALQQIERFGVMDYHAEVPYGIGGQARGSDGRFYVSVTTPNTGNDPVTDGGANWIVDSGPGDNVVTFTSPGTTSWTVPPELSSGLRLAHVTVVGGGAAGVRVSGDAGGGGGGGGSSIALVDLSGESSISVTVGEGGAPGASGADGTNGGDSSFNGSIVGAGGSGGSANSRGGGNGGSGSGGDINIRGGGGGSGKPGIGSRFVGGFGGSSSIQPSSPESSQSVATNGASGLRGSGGSGGILNGNGGAGGDGIVIIRW